MTKQSYDVVVIGGGHAGCEAAAASARMGVNTALFTHKIETIGEMSCNPAIGGLGKGHLVREIDALDGVMGVVADKSGIQFRLLNRSRGPAVQGPRTQSDRALYKEHMQKILLNYKNLKVIADPVVKFLFEGDKIIGFICQSGKEVRTKELILTTGTFLNGLIHIGETQIPAGRYDEKPSTGLSEQLAKFKMQIGRLKTGTPPRLDGSTINYDDLEMQPADDDHYYFGSVLALELKRQGHEVTLVSPAGRVCSWGEFTDEQTRSNTEIIKAGIKVINNYKIEVVMNGIAELSCIFSGEPKEVPCDFVVPITRKMPVTDLYDNLCSRADNWGSNGVQKVIKIGDAEAPSIIAAAVHSGYRSAIEVDNPASDALNFSKREHPLIK